MHYLRWLAIFFFLFQMLHAVESDDYDVIVVGAGISGIAAANALQKNGLKVLVIEAKERVGGRIWTTFEWGMPTEHGANWIHSSKNNPVFTLAKSYGLKVFPTIGEVVSTSFSWFDSYALFDEKGKRIDPKEIQRIVNAVIPAFYTFLLASDPGQNFNALFNKFIKENPLPKRDEQILHYMVTLLSEFHLGADPGQVSPETLLGRLMLTKTSGKDMVVEQGYVQVLAPLVKNIPILLNQPVRKVSYSNQGVTVQTFNHRYRARFALMTVPLGVLKQKSVQFDPPLPQEKQNAISKLGMGVFNKAFLLFEKPFWDPDVQFFALLPQENDAAVKIEFVNFYKYFKQPVLMAFIAGSFAKTLEVMTDEATVDFLMAQLKKMYGKNIPFPTSAIITRWGTDPYTQGSYSFPKTGVTLQDYEALAKPVVGRLFFAGEATSASDSSSVHGAYQSGIDAAKAIQEAAQKERITQV